MVIKQLGLCLEVTEQAALQLDDRLEQRFQNIKSYGFHLAVDDFSMGNTSLQYLIKDYFDLVKIDGSLVQNICTNKRCKDIISSIIQLSQSLDFQVIAEYVSTADIRNELADIGCYNYQGWFYSTAIPDRKSVV